MERWGSPTGRRPFAVRSVFLLRDLIRVWEGGSVANYFCSLEAFCHLTGEGENKTNDTNGQKLQTMSGFSVLKLHAHLGLISLGHLAFQMLKLEEITAFLVLFCGQGLNLLINAEGNSTHNVQLLTQTSHDVAENGLFCLPLNFLIYINITLNCKCIILKVVDAKFNVQTCG